MRRGREVLLFHRRRYPIGWTIPAGHVEQGTDPETKMRREVLEEVGLTVVSARPLWPGESVLLKDSCRRGADLHRWHVYDVEAEGDVCVGEEGDRFGWYREDELSSLDLIPPVRKILKRAFR